MRYIVTDTETTGLDPEKDEIVEVAAVSRLPGKTVLDDHLLIRDGMCRPDQALISPEAMATHHITHQMVLGLPSPATVVRDVICTVGLEDTTYMVAHNAAFDRGFIGRLMPELAPPARWICTWRCAMHIWPDAPSHSNQVLRYWRGLMVSLPTDLYPHRALYDTLVTEALLVQMMQSGRTLEQLAELTTKPVLQTTIRFGKHRGSKWSDLPRSYVEWILREQGMDPDVKHTAMHYVRNQGRLL